MYYIVGASQEYLVGRTWIFSGQITREVILMCWHFCPRLFNFFIFLLLILFPLPLFSLLLSPQIYPLVPWTTSWSATRPVDPTHSIYPKWAPPDPWAPLWTCKTLSPLILPTILILELGPQTYRCNTCVCLCAIHTHTHSQNGDGCKG